MKRDIKNKMFGGVCAGIAKSMNVDPMFVRLAFVLSFFMWGIGPFIYLILWLLMKPEEN